MLPVRGLAVPISTASAPVLSLQPTYARPQNRLTVLLVSFIKLSLENKKGHVISDLPSFCILSNTLMIALHCAHVNNYVTVMLNGITTA